MKRISAIIMAAVMLILCSCGSNATGQDSMSADNNGQTEIRRGETNVAEKSGMNDGEENGIEINDTVNSTAIQFRRIFF